MRRRPARPGARSPRRGLTLVYGGAAVGLMGALADAALAAGGEVVGVIPGALVEREIAHAGLTELHPVKSMHERKAHDGRPLRRLHRAAGRRRHAGGAVRDLDLGASSAITGSRSGSSTSTASSMRCSRFLDHQTRERFMRREHRDMLIWWRAMPERLLDRFADVRARRSWRNGSGAASGEAGAVAKGAERAVPTRSARVNAWERPDGSLA